MLIGKQKSFKPTIKYVRNRKNNTYDEHATWQKQF